MTQQFFLINEDDINCEINRCLNKMRHLFLIFYMIIFETPFFLVVRQIVNKSTPREWVSDKLKRIKYLAYLHFLLHKESSLSVILAKKIAVSEWVSLWLKDKHVQRGDSYLKKTVWKWHMPSPLFLLYTYISYAYTNTKSSKQKIYIEKIHITQYAYYICIQNLSQSTYHFFILHLL